MIEKHGGYKFTAPVVPSTFNFGGTAPGMNWIIHSSFYYSVTDCSEVKKKQKACVVPLSSGSGTGSSQSFFNLWKQGVAAVDDGLGGGSNQNAANGWGKQTKDLSTMRDETLWTTLFSGAQLCRRPWRQLFTLFLFFSAAPFKTNWSMNSCRLIMGLIKRHHHTCCHKVVSWFYLWLWWRIQHHFIEIKTKPVCVHTSWGCSFFFFFFLQAAFGQNNQRHL